MPRSSISLLGQHFGKLKVIEKIRLSKPGISRWKCRCECGNVKSGILYTSLVRGESTSCGACHLVKRGPKPKKQKPTPPTLPKPPPLPRPLSTSKIGEKLGRWTILARVPNSSIQYKARCECGTEKEINYYAARDGKTLSCGCYRKELIKDRFRLHPASPHLHLQHTQANPLYSSWQSIKTRCFNSNHPSYERYGKRGISMSEEWRTSFLSFATHMGPKPSEDHTLERINNDGDYEPGNVRWATKTEQAENTRNNPEVSYQGQTLRLRDLADKLSVDRSLLRYYFIIQAKPIEEAITKAKNYQTLPPTLSESVQKPRTSFIDLTGTKVANYTVISYQGRKSPTSPSLWLVKCDECGSTQIATSQAVRRGTLRPCIYTIKEPDTQDFC